MSRVSEFWSNLSPGGRRGVVGGGVGTVLVLVGAVLVLGGGSEPEPVVADITTTTTAPPTTIVTTTSEPAQGVVAPLTGLRVADETLLNRPPLAMKIDNLDAARESALPQSGIPRADVVFEEIVEGNITRLVAVFHSQQPGTVGPVRSARTTDVELLPQLGRPLLGWSGGNQGVTAAVQASPWIVDAGWDSAPGDYFRQSGKQAPHNLFARADELWRLAPADAPPPPPLFEYRTEGQQNPPGAQPSQGVDINWGTGVAVAPVSWRWRGDLGRYVRSQAGREHKDSDGTVLTASNVVVLVTDYGQSSADSRSPEAHTVGSGELFVFSNGGVVHGRWDRPEITKPATLVDDRGEPVQLTPGQTWIELPRPGATAAVPG